ncbi:MAG: hypothetical protein M0C28_31165 [Candidatus Moduliflexus flocculans]|nr:hypothetical protein [Candidatus Moduliflexus flocculans]
MERECDVSRVPALLLLAGCAALVLVLARRPIAGNARRAKQEVVRMNLASVADDTIFFVRSPPSVFAR